MDLKIPAARTASDDGLCAEAYNDFYHKIKAEVGYDSWRAIWQFIRRRIVTEEMLRHADLGCSVEKSAGTIPEGHELVFLKIRSASLNDATMVSLGALAEAISSGQQVFVAVGPAGERLQALLKLIDQKFASGNDVPVERITLTQAELEGLDAAPGGAV